MILNHYSVLTSFMAGLGTALAGVLAGTALVAARRIRRSRGQQETSSAERSVHLATLVAVVCLGILLTGWPLFYAMLHSFVPEVPGAMCIYGVTRVMPATAALVQVANPAVIFVLGAWLLLEHVRRQSARPPRRAAGMLALAAVALLMAFACGSELYYIFNMESLQEVSCCSGYGEGAGSKLQAPSDYLPWALPGDARRLGLTVAFWAGAPLLALWLLVQASGRALRHRGLALAENAARLATSLGLGWLFLLALSEILAPVLMRLPFHHCLYCLVTSGRVPESPLIVANLGMGVFAAGWSALLGVALQTGAPGAWRVHRRVCILGATTLSASVLMIMVHLAVRGG